MRTCLPVNTVREPIDAYIPYQLDVDLSKESDEVINLLEEAWDCVRWEYTDRENFYCEKTEVWFSLFQHDRKLTISFANLDDMLKYVRANGITVYFDRYMDVIRRNEGEIETKKKAIASIANYMDEG